MNILHFSYDHPANPWLGGGGARRTWAVNRILSQSHNVQVICGAFPGAESENSGGEPFQVRFAGTASGYIASRLKYIAFSRQVDTGPYDLVVEDFSVYAPVFPRLRHKPLVSIVHALYGLGALQYKGLLGLMAIWGEHVLLPRKKNVIAVSNHIVGSLKNAAHVQVIGQGVTIPEDLPESSEECVLSLGRLDFQVKGLDILLDAWAEIPSHERTLPLYLAGGGDEKSVLEKIARCGLEDVRLLGRLDHRAALEAINRAAFICIPSRSEGFPLVAVEAMGLGKPLIVSDIPSLKANIPHEVAGLQVPAGNPQELAKAIRVLLRDTVLRKKLATGAGEEGRKFDWQMIAERQEGFYLEVLAGAGK